ncbi:MULTISPECIES: NADP-dependent oxidoreductase [Subtercola]|uniref:NADP-dependent oxidoreductase n=1 Tax=Subtercola vilae TaxID=2056433 RepID=A0A4T2BZC7_9MICO|nr:MULTISPECIES: NADP-dependent oxidoreductase [Subtercola]MEA9986027.1 NADP-dependent oxidoreductase [Subtercola sp. RTI3]TIH36950.1 NADP-dependent oxidoreductase [Subtercola vilae]
MTSSTSNNDTGTSNTGTSNTSTQWHLVSRPSGEPTGENVVRVAVDLPELGEGEVRVANEFLSVDPYMRGRMNAGRSYVPPFELGEPMTGAAVGRVTASRSERFAVGDTVQHQLGWRDVAQGPEREFRAAPPVPGHPLSVYLGALGLTGITAWVGLTQIAKVREGDVVFVSGAAGGVGTMVGQIARLKGASRVIGSAGTAAKLELLQGKYGFDAVFNYRDGDVAGQLKNAAPGGIDVYFDNVGGDHLEAALRVFNDGGRAALCGSVGGYNSVGDDPGVRHLTNIITRGLTLQGFTMPSYYHLAPAFAAEMQPWLAAGEIVYDETVVHGIDRAFEAFLGMMHGENVGKMIVAP